MHLLLTDRLACPRCGPAFGLILLAERVVERRVLVGSLGCPNCRDRFVVADGFADLRPPPRRALPDEPPPPEPHREGTLRLAALLGVSEGPATVALAGSAAEHAAALADLVPELEVAAAGTPGLRALSERAGVSRMVVGDRLPFRDRSLQGVALAGAAAEPLLEEAARVVVPPGRVVVLDAPPETRGALEGAGFQVFLEEEGVVVAAPAGPRPPSGGVRLPVV